MNWVNAATAAGLIRTRYMVGCGGGRSTVRKALGVAFAGETFETGAQRNLDVYCRRHHRTKHTWLVSPPGLRWHAHLDQP